MPLTASADMASRHLVAPGLMSVLELHIAQSADKRRGQLADSELARSARIYRISF